MVKINIYKLQCFVNFVISFLLYFQSKENTLCVNYYTEILSLQCIFTIGAFANIYFRNNLVMLLNFFVTIFFAIRAITLNFTTNYSDVFLRNTPTNDFSSKIIFLGIQYLVIYLSLLFFKRYVNIKRYNHRTPAFTKYQILVVFILIQVSICLSILAFCWQNKNILSIASTIFSPYNVLYLFTFIFISNQKHKKNLAILYLISIVEFAFLNLCFGNKSGLLNVLLLLFLSFLACEKYQIKIQHIIFICCSLVFAAFLFYIGNIIRILGVDLINIIDSCKNLNVINDLIPSFAYRIGYLDFYLDKTANPIYKDIISMQYYAKSIFDKITPFVDPFETSFASRAIAEAWSGAPSTGTSSEQMTVFAESYLLFGYYGVFYLISILILFFVLFTKSKKSLFPFSGIFFVFIIYDWLNGFGLDMVIADAIYLFIFFKSIQYILSIKPSYKAKTYFYESTC